MNRMCIISELHFVGISTLKYLLVQSKIHHVIFFLLEYYYIRKSFWLWLYVHSVFLRVGVALAITCFLVMSRIQ